MTQGIWLVHRPASRTIARTEYWRRNDAGGLALETPGGEQRMLFANAGAAN